MLLILRRIVTEEQSISPTSGPLSSLLHLTLNSFIQRHIVCDKQNKRQWRRETHFAALFFTVRRQLSPHFRPQGSVLTSPVPGSSQRFIDKSRSLTADCVAYDLEDSVTPHKKAEARSLVRKALDEPSPASIRERAVRINSVDSGLALADLTEVVRLVYQLSHVI